MKFLIAHWIVITETRFIDSKLYIVSISTYIFIFDRFRIVGAEINAINRNFLHYIKIIVVSAPSEEGEKSSSFSGM
jgi:hypothetical protein